MLGSDKRLVAFSPETEVPVDNYSVGINAGASLSGPQIGISAITSVTKKSLEISNLCSSKRFKINFKYKNYDYAQSYHSQRAAYSFTSLSRNQWNVLFVKAEFGARIGKTNFVIQEGINKIEQKSDHLYYNK